MQLLEDPAVQQAIFAGVIPGFIAGVTLMIAWVFWPMTERRRLQLPPITVTAPPGPRWLLPVLFAVGAVFSTYALNGGWSEPWPIIASYRLQPLAVAAGLLVLLLHLFGPRGRRWAIAAVLVPAAGAASVAFIWSVSERFLIDGGVQHGSATTIRAAFTAAAIIAVALQAIGSESAARAAPKFGAPLAMLIIAATAMKASFDAPFAGGALLLAPVTAVLSASLVVAVFARSFTVTGGALATASFLVSCVLMIANWHGGFIWWSMTLLALAPAAIGLAPLTKKIHPRAPGPAAILIAMAFAAASQAPGLLDPPPPTESEEPAANPFGY